MCEALGFSSTQFSIVNQFSSVKKKKEKKENVPVGALRTSHNFNALSAPNDSNVFVPVHDNPITSSSCADLTNEYQTKMCWHFFGLTCASLLPVHVGLLWRSGVAKQHAAARASHRQQRLRPVVRQHADFGAIFRERMRRARGRAPHRGAPISLGVPRSSANVPAA